jgi:hypothetical protein
MYCGIDPRMTLAPPEYPLRKSMDYRANPGNGIADAKRGFPCGFVCRCLSRRLECPHQGRP